MLRGYRSRRDGGRQVARGRRVGAADGSGVAAAGAGNPGGHGRRGRQVLPGRRGRRVLLAHQRHKVGEVVVAVLVAVTPAAVAAVMATVLVCTVVGVGQAVVVHLTVVGTWRQMLMWQTCTITKMNQCQTDSKLPCKHPAK